LFMNTIDYDRLVHPCFVSIGHALLSIERPS